MRVTLRRWESCSQLTANLLYKNERDVLIEWVSQIIHSSLCLSLNKSWYPIGTMKISEAIIALSGGGQDGGHPAYAMDMEVSPDGQLLSCVPTPWEEWIMLPVRSGDLAIRTARGAIRAPTVVIQRHYNKIPVKRPKLSKRAIWERDNGICGYTGRKLTRSAANVDHIIPKSRGGKDDWTNLILADAKVNTMKGNRLNHEAGLTLLRSPKAPPSVPASISIAEARHDSWKPFLITR